MPRKPRPWEILDKDGKPLQMQIDLDTEIETPEVVQPRVLSTVGEVLRATLYLHYHYLLCKAKEAIKETPKEWIPENRKSRIKGLGIIYAELHKMRLLVSSRKTPYKQILELAEVHKMLTYKNTNTEAKILMEYPDTKALAYIVNVSQGLFHQGSKAIVMVKYRGFYRKIAMFVPADTNAHNYIFVLSAFHNISIAEDKKVLSLPAVRLSREYEHYIFRSESYSPVLHNRYIHDDPAVTDPPFVQYLSCKEARDPDVNQLVSKWKEEGEITVKTIGYTKYHLEASTCTAFSEDHKKKNYRDIEVLGLNGYVNPFPSNSLPVVVNVLKLKVFKLVSGGYRIGYSRMPSQIPYNIKEDIAHISDAFDAGSTIEKIEEEFNNNRDKYKSIYNAAHENAGKIMLDKKQERYVAVLEVTESVPGLIKLASIRVMADILLEKR